MIPKVLLVSMFSIIQAKHLEFVKCRAWDLGKGNLCLQERNDGEELSLNV